MNDDRVAPLDEHGPVCGVDGCENEAAGAVQGWKQHPAAVADDEPVWVNTPLCVEHLAQCQADGVQAFLRDTLIKGIA